ncbi:MAG: EAL domain-containing protein [Paraglaciecola sp.]|uniref:EAL domain-containing protein n=1 Tax=Paraglaciecola sp. TaxID=1920173 RepID=UPI003298A095
MSLESSLIQPLLNAKTSEDIVQSSLNFVRKHLGMEVAYLSEFVGDDLVFRAVDAPGMESMIAVGGSMPLEQVYCRHIIEGKLPELIPDTSQEPIAQKIALTTQIPIKSHVSVPIRRKDGSVYGMFCCLSRQIQSSLNSRDLDVMKAFASLSSQQINDTISMRTEQTRLRLIFSTIIETRDIDIVYQPIMDNLQHKPVGFEALSRFKSEPYRPPNFWFEQAESVEMLKNLEICAIEVALEDLKFLPKPVYLSVNASPSTIETGRLKSVFESFDCDRIVLEVTEHAEVTNHELLMKELSILRDVGVRLAIDDVGVGYSGLQQIVRLQPDIIKLDISLIAGIDKDIVKRSLTQALVGFAIEIGAKIVAEGIETEEELATLIALNVPLGQGYLLGRPADLQSALDWFATK